MMSGVLLLQFHDDVSDGEAVEWILYDIRWKVALNLPLDYAGFDPSALSVFRTRLVEHNQERIPAPDSSFSKAKIAKASKTTSPIGCHGSILW